VNASGESFQKNVPGKPFRWAVEAAPAVVLGPDRAPFRGITVSLTVVPQEALENHRGRPRAGASLKTRREYPLSVQVAELLPEAIQTERERRSRLIVGSNKLGLPIDRGWAWEPSG